MVRVLRVDKLRPGDLILETGNRKIAAGTAGPFGHASIALGRLIRIEAGDLDSTVEVTPFDLTTWHSGDHTIVGVNMGMSDVVVLRSRKLGIGTIDGETLWEAGRPYSLEKLRSLPDLTPWARRCLEKAIKEKGGSGLADPEARFCSEVAARILQLAEPEVSPNALRSAEGLDEVREAVEELGPEWQMAPVATKTADLAQRITGFRNNMAQIIMTAAEHAALAVEADPSSSEQMITDLNRYAHAEIAQAILALQSVRELEPEILEPGRSAD